MKSQLNNCKKKAIAGLCNIARISKFIDCKQRIQLVHGLVLSQLDYCNSLYYSLPNGDLHAIQMIINSAIRVIKGLPRFSRERITPLAIELHFLPIKARIEYKIALLAHKALIFGQPHYLSSLLEPYTTASGVELRSSGRLAEPLLSRATSVSRCFEHSAPRIYNSLPDDVKIHTCIQTFKKKLKTHMFLKAYDLPSRTINSDYRA